MIGRPAIRREEGLQTFCRFLVVTTTAPPLGGVFVFAFFGILF